MERIVVERCILDVWHSSEYAFAKYFMIWVFYTIFMKRSTLDVWQGY